MFLPLSKVTEVAKEMVQELRDAGDLETESPYEVQLDLEAVLRQYLRTEQEITTQARDTLASRGLAPTEYGRIVKNLSDQRGVKVGEDAMDYVLDQLAEMLLNSAHVEELYVEDHELRRRLRIPLRKHANQAPDLDRAVRKQMKHVEEGGALWEIEYRRMLDEIRRRRGM
ncbi:MAG: hypothetical protein B6A08_18975 [Sorangiineae bacterium NIC37A_2]|jgi:hypothetical protein|nr:MAG: hypothetical protein B6A08_18975 [Sorangiineae bacterium NIC37A_2]